MTIRLRAALAVTGVLVLSSLTAVGVDATAAHATYGGKDGRLAFAMTVDGYQHIFTVRPNGHGLTELTSGSFTDSCPAYSASGKHIAFCSNRTGSYEIWIMTSTGGDLHQVTDLTDAGSPHFSPNGKRVVFDGSNGNAHQVYVAHSDGTHLHQLTHGTDNNYFPTWSPDGDSIAFVSDRTGDEQVFSMRSDGTHQKQLTSKQVTHDQYPDWSPDGRRIVYVQGNGAEKIWVMNADGSHKRKVTHGTDDDFQPAWSPNGRHLAFIRDDGAGDRALVICDADGRHVHAVHDPNQMAQQLAPAWQPLH